MKVSFSNNQIFIKMTLKSNLKIGFFTAVFEFPFKFITGISAAI